MERHTEQRAEAKPEGSKTELSVSRSDENPAISTQTRPIKERPHGSCENSSTINKAGAEAAQKQAKTIKKKKRAGNATAAARTSAKKKPAATATAPRAAEKRNPAGGKVLRRKVTSADCGELESLKIQLASTQEALQKVLQCYCVECVPRSLDEKGSDAAEVTTESMVHREIHALKRLVSFLTEGQVPLAVPPDFFYVLSKQYLDGTWTDICAAAARAASHFSGENTATVPAAERTAVSVETVHEIPPFAVRNIPKGTAAAAGGMQTTGTAAGAVPQQPDVSGAPSRTAQIEEVEQLICVEVEGQEPMEWRDVYRLPVEGPPVLVSSSASKSACAATVSTESMKREPPEVLQQRCDKPKGRQLSPSQRPNTTDNARQEEQQQQERVVFTMQQQHAAERACNVERESSRSSLTLVNDIDRTACLGSTTAGQSEPGRRALVSPRGETSHGKGAKDSEGTSDLPSALLKAVAGTPPQQHQPHSKLASPALARAAATAAEKQQIPRKTAEARQDGGSQSAVLVRDIPALKEDTSGVAPRHVLYFARNGSGGSRAGGDRWTSPSWRATNDSSSFAIGSTETESEHTFKTVEMSASAVAQGESRDTERLGGNRTPAITSLFAGDPGARSAEAPGTKVGAAAGAARGGREKKEASSETPSLSHEEMENGYFVPAPGRRRESISCRSSLDVASGPPALPLGSTAPSARSEKPSRQQEETGTPRVVGGSESPVRRPAATPAASAAGKTGAAASTVGKCHEGMQSVYISNFFSNTGAGSPIPSPLYYTPTRLHASPPPSPVFPFLHAAGAAVGGGATERSDIYAEAAGHRTIFVPPSASYPYGALLPESFVIPPPPPSPASPVPAGWRAHIDATTMPMLLAAAAAAHETDGAASLTFLCNDRSRAREDTAEQDVQDGRAAATAAAIHKVTGREREGKLEERKDGSANSNETGEQKKEQEAGSSAGPDILPSSASGSAAMLSSHPQAEENRQGVLQRQRQAAPAYWRSLHPAAAPRSANVTPRWQEGGGTAAVGGRDILADSGVDGGYDEGAAEALGCKVYRHSARSGGATYDVFKTAPVQAVLLAHAQEMFVPVFWNENGEPVSWPRVKVTLPPSAAATSPQPSEKQQPEQQQRQHQVQERQQQGQKSQQQKQEQRQAADPEEREMKKTLFFAPMPCFFDTEHHGAHSAQQKRQGPQHGGVELICVFPPRRQHFQWSEQGGRRKFQVDNSTASSGFAPPVPLSPRHVSDDRTGAQPNAGHGAATPGSSTSASHLCSAAAGADAVAASAASAALFAAGSNIAEDTPAAPRCGFQHPPLPSCSQLLGTQLFTSTCCVAPSSTSGAQARGRDSAKILKGQQHQQGHWTGPKESVAELAAADRRAEQLAFEETADRMRRVPPVDKAGTRQVVGANTPARKADARCSAVAVAETLSGALTAATAAVPYWSYQASSSCPGGSLVSPLQQQPIPEEARRPDGTGKPRVKTHSEEVLTSAATLQRLNSILKEASDLDKRLKEVDGKVEKLLRRRRSRVVDARQ